MTEPTPLKHLPVLLTGAATLAAAALGLFWFASVRSASTPAPEGLAVTVDGAACTPMALEVPAGQARFRITNASERPLEWEILDGVMVLAERENIAPGFSADLVTRLKPGVYTVTCGLLSNPRGTLTVTATAQSEAERAAPPLRDFLGPMAERRVQLLRAAGKFDRAAKGLQAAIAAGDMASAKAAWAEAASYWAALGAAAPRAADLQNRIAPQAEWLEAREQDAAFTGLTRLEYGLYRQGSTAGLGPEAAALAADAEAFGARIRALDLTPDMLVADAARHAQRLADEQAGGGLARYAGDDRAELAAALESLAQTYAVLAPLVRAASPEAAQKAEAELAATGASLRAQPLDRAAVSARFSALAGALGQINATLGLEQ